MTVAPRSAHILIAGGGIGGLAAALASARAGAQRVHVFEQATAWGEVGAGVQLGPNAVRVLGDWGLLPALTACAAFPDALRVRDSGSGAQLGRLRLGERARQRYGQPYATVHRADLHGLLLQAVQTHPEVQMHLGQRVEALTDGPDGVSMQYRGGETQGDLMLGCDGLWSPVRLALCGNGPTFTGHLAYRGMVRQADWPATQRQTGVTAWLGPRHHVVHYPVRGGEWLNVVAVVQGAVAGDAQDWSHEAHADALVAALGRVHSDLGDLLRAVPGWTLWPLHDRAPMTGPHQQAQGRVALMGDAAHPMRPYLAQGAAMALEDAWVWGQMLAQTTGSGTDLAALPLRFARHRWARNAWVQARARRNGWVFHLDGPLRLARNLAMALVGERLMDVPRLYGGPPAP